MATDSWAAVPWVRESSDDSKLQTWHKHLVPYKPDANVLQNLDVWVPLKGDEDPDSVPDSVTRDGLWVIYIHGGAWKDPFVTSTAFAPTIAHLDPAIKDSVAGFASINYSLSPNPDHPTNPSPPKDPNTPIDPSRQAKHPDHIIDVLTGLASLQERFGFGNNYILIGHSCGATLAFQVASDNARWASSVPAVKKPKAIVGLNGLYDLPQLILSPGEKHQQLSALYEKFTAIAFGDDKKAWTDVSPAAVDDWASKWPEGTKAFLVQSKEDQLVPYNQLEGFKQVLAKSKGANLEVIELEAVGNHDTLWFKGDKLAEMVAEVVKIVL